MAPLLMRAKEVSSLGLCNESSVWHIFVAFRHSPLYQRHLSEVLDQQLPSNCCLRSLFNKNWLKDHYFLLQQAFQQTVLLVCLRTGSYSVCRTLKNKEQKKRVSCGSR